MWNNQQQRGTGPVGVHYSNGSGSNWSSGSTNPFAPQAASAWSHGGLGYSQTNPYQVRHVGGGSRWDPCGNAGAAFGSSAAHGQRVYMGGSGRPSNSSMFG